MPLKNQVWCLILIPGLFSTACNKNTPANPDTQETVLIQSQGSQNQATPGHERNSYNTDGTAAATEHIKNTYIDEYGNLIYTVVEQKPTFLGGEEAFQAYLSNNLRYPQKAIHNNAAGTVMVAFIINIDGSIKDVELARGLDDPDLNQEAMRLISEMPNWNPGIQNGEKVNVKYTVPVKFEVDLN